MGKESTGIACRGSVRKCSISEFSSRAAKDFAECLKLGCVSEEELNSKTPVSNHLTFSSSEFIVPKGGRTFFEKDTVEDLIRCGVFSRRQGNLKPSPQNG